MCHFQFAQLRMLSLILVFVWYFQFLCSYGVFQIYMSYLKNAAEFFPFLRLPLLGEIRFNVSQHMILIFP